MAVAARVAWLIGRIRDGAHVRVVAGPAADTNQCKIRFEVHENRAPLPPVPRSVLLALTMPLLGLCEEMVVVDRGHRFSAGVVEVAVWFGSGKKRNEQHQPHEEVFAPGGALRDMLPGVLATQALSGGAAPADTPAETVSAAEDVERGSSKGVGADDYEPPPKRSRASAGASSDCMDDVPMLVSMENPTGEHPCYNDTPPVAPVAAASSPTSSTTQQADAAPTSPDKTFAALDTGGKLEMIRMVCKGFSKITRGKFHTTFRRIYALPDWREAIRQLEKQYREVFITLVVDELDLHGAFPSGIPALAMEPIEESVTGDFRFFAIGVSPDAEAGPSAVDPVPTAAARIASPTPKGSLASALRDAPGFGKGPRRTRKGR